MFTEHFHLRKTFFFFFLTFVKCKSAAGYKLFTARAADSEANLPDPEARVLPPPILAPPSSLPRLIRGRRTSVPRAEVAVPLVCYLNYILPLPPLTYLHPLCSSHTQTVQAGGRVKATLGAGGRFGGHLAGPRSLSVATADPGPAFTATSAHPRQEYVGA